MPLPKPTMVTVKMAVPPNVYGFKQINSKVIEALESLKGIGYDVRSWSVTK